MQKRCCVAAELLLHAQRQHDQRFGLRVAVCPFMANRLVAKLDLLCRFAKAEAFKQRAVRPIAPIAPRPSGVL